MAQSLVARSMPPNSFLNRQQNSRGPPMGSSLGFQNRGSTRGARSGGRGTPQSPGAILALTPALGATEAVGARIPCHLVRSTGTTAGIRDLSTHHRAVSYLTEYPRRLDSPLSSHRAEPHPQQRQIFCSLVAAIGVYVHAVQDNNSVGRAYRNYIRAWLGPRWLATVPRTVGRRSGL